MSATPQSQAINGANDALFCAQQLQQVRTTIDNFLKQYVAANYSAEWNAFATAPANTDGSLGSRLEQILNTLGATVRDIDIQAATAGHY